MNETEKEISPNPMVEDGRCVAPMNFKLNEKWKQQTANGEQMKFTSRSLW